MINKKEDPIAVFDSGVGGISVLRELVHVMPNENFLFFGDSKNAPYGVKKTEEVQALTMEHATHFLSEGAKAIVVACNTATSAGIQLVRETYPDKIIVGIEPALKPAVLSKKGGRVLVLATNMTLREEKFAKLMENYRNQAEIIPLPAPHIVEYVEGGLANEQDILDYLNEILAPFKADGNHVDSIVLGCTHFPFVKDSILKAIGYEVELFDGGLGTARETHRLLEEADLLTESTEPGSVTFMNSKNSKAMIALSERLLHASDK